MNNINLTLVLQIVHFVIAYYILSKFIFKPGLKALLEDITLRNQISQNIVQLHESINLKEQIRTAKWKECQGYFQEHKPEIKPEGILRLDLSNVQVVQELPAKEVVQLAGQVVQDLKSKIVKQKL